MGLVKVKMFSGEMIEVEPSGEGMVCREGYTSKWGRVSRASLTMHTRYLQYCLIDFRNNEFIGTLHHLEAFGIQFFLN